MPAWFGNLARLFYIVAVRLTGAVLGNVSRGRARSSTPSTATATRPRYIAPITDQNLAGAIMMVEGSILTLGLFCWLFLRAAREGEERQDLLDLAAAQGVELTEARAARAVAAGRGADLRRRLQAGDGAHGAPRASAAANYPPATAGRIVTSRRPRRASRGRRGSGCPRPAT